jgi:hypothetical protein
LASLVLHRFGVDLQKLLRLVLQEKWWPEQLLYADTDAISRKTAWSSNGPNKSGVLSSVLI